MVAAQIQVPQNSGPPNADSAEESNPLQLRVIPDPFAPEQWFCVHKFGAHSLHAPWLQTLAANVADCELSMQQLPSYILCNII